MNTSLLLLAGAAVLGQNPPPDLSDCLRSCPPINDPAPFLRSPAQELLTDCRDSYGCDKAAANLRDDGRWRHTFHTAARFPYPRFGQCGEPADTDGLMIYEGMRLTVNPDTGVYDLSFTATAPATPVTVRLQMVFHPPGRPDFAVRLTLPPIEIDPVPTADPLRPKPATVRVSHRGFSELFLATDRQSASSDLRAKPPIDPYRTFGVRPELPVFRVTKDWTIIRAGSARFGSDLPNSDGVSR